jgi:hypothetical protein
MPCEADQRSRLCVTGSSPEAWQRVGAWWVVFARPLTRTPRSCATAAAANAVARSDVSAFQIIGSRKIGEQARLRRLPAQARLGQRAGSGVVLCNEFAEKAERLFR